MIRWCISGDVHRGKYGELEMSRVHFFTGCVSVVNSYKEWMVRGGD